MCSASTCKQLLLLLAHAPARAFAANPISHQLTPLERQTTTAWLSKPCCIICSAAMCLTTPEGREGEFLQPKGCQVRKHTVLDCICPQRRAPAVHRTLQAALNSVCMWCLLLSMEFPAAPERVCAAALCHILRAQQHCSGEQLPHSMLANSWCYVAPVVVKEGV
jgi:hypothetical protein